MGRRNSKQNPKEIKCNRCQKEFDDSYTRDRHRRVCPKIIPNKKLLRLQKKTRRIEAANAQFLREAEQREAAAERAEQNADSVPVAMCDQEETGKKLFHISIVVIGHVDAGKSTTIGHLIYMVGGIDGCVVEQYEKQSAEMNRASYKFAWILDKLKAERERGLTIDISLQKFETTKYRCTVIDTPGHRDFLKNMITGTSQADCALLVIDSTAGAFEAGMSEDGQTREHVILAFILGVKQIICCCNKMDATVPKYAKERFDEIVNAVTPFLKRTGYKTNRISFIPISGFEGDNLTQRSMNMEWYKGPTLIDAIDMIYEPKRHIKMPLRLPIRDVYNIGQIGSVCVGCIATGTLKAQATLTIAPPGLTTKVKSVEMHGEAISEAIPGDIVGFSSKNLSTTDVKRGHVASNSKDNPAKCATSFTSQVILLNHPGVIRKGYTPLLHCHTSHTPVTFSELISKVHKRPGQSDYEVIESEPECLTKNDCALVRMQPTKPLVVEAFHQCPPLGRFAVRDFRKTVAVGVIKSVDKDQIVRKVD